MKNTEQMYRHGDLLLRKVTSVPANAKPTANTILAEGEVTGHKHRLTGQVQVFEDGTNKYFSVSQSAQLVHEEHKPIEIEAGNYVVVHEREFNPFEEAIREVAD